MIPQSPPMVWSEEQQALREVATSLCAERAPVSQLRALRDDRNPLGYDPDLYAEMADLGWCAMGFPEALGGLDLGLTEMAAIAEPMGRHLVASPMLAPLVLAGSALMRGGSVAQKEQWIPAIASGDALLSLAWEEPHTRNRWWTASTTATRTPRGWSLSGHKVGVLDGHIAHAHIVVARTSDDGFSLFLVPRDHPGLTCERLHQVDSRNSARLLLDGVDLGEDALVGVLDGGADLLEFTLDRGAAVLSAEMLGSARAAFDLARAYLAERTQFGKPIGSFQALQHRASRMFMALELAQSASDAAVRVADQRPSELAPYASLAKARCSDLYLHIASEAIQLFGGIGMTDEHDIGFYLKRARTTAWTFGDGHFHRQRWAKHHGY